MSISKSFDMSSARREIERIIETYNNFESKREEIGKHLQVVLKKHGHKSANFLVQELKLNEYNIEFVCPVISYLKSLGLVSDKKNI